AKKAYYPSSIGLSFLVRPRTSSLTALVTWGDYVRAELPKSELGLGAAVEPDAEADDEETLRVWRRIPQERDIELPLTLEEGSVPVPDSDGLELHVLARPIQTEALQGRIPDGTLSVSVFLVNARSHASERPDERYAFQPQLEIHSEAPFVPRPDLRGLQAVTHEWDDMVADLHYADAYEFATGHGIAAGWDEIDGACHTVRTRWIPEAVVEKTVTARVDDVELGMEALGALEDGEAVQASLSGLVRQYREWIDSKSRLAAQLAGVQNEV